MERNYNIPQDNQQAFLDKIAKLNKKAQKLDCAPIVATEVNSFYATVDGRTIKYYVYDVQGLAPKMNGWSFVASVEVMKTGNLVKNIPDVAEADLKWHTESLSCEHCKVDRRRKAFFILRNEEGAEISVGRSCLKDFLGHKSPQRVAAFMESLGELRGCGVPGEREIEYYPIEAILEVARAIIRRKGFVSRKAAQEGYDKTPTAELVGTYFRQAYSGADKAHLEKFRKEFAPTTEDTEKTKKVLEWIDGLAGENNFEANLKLLKAEEYVSAKHFGLLAAAAFFGCDKEEKVVKSNEWLGTIGERVTLELKVVDTREIETGYGVSHLITFEDEAGNVVKWFSSRIQDELEIDTNVTVTGRVKDHADWKGRKQTMLTRCTLTVQKVLEKAC